MEMAGRGYLRALAAAPAVRVKLLFVDEIAAHMNRHRGFSSCWFLVPSHAKIVGDLLHEIAHEFDLLERCPAGLELLLDGSHVLANQEIDVIRDNDTLGVQCAVFTTEETDRLESSTKKPSKKRAREAESSKGGESQGKKTKRRETDAKSAKVQEQTTAASTDTTRSGTSRSRRKPVLPALDVESSSSDSSSSSSDSSSEEEQATKPPKAKATREAFKAVMKDTVKAMKRDVTVKPSSSSSSSSSSSDSDDSSSDSDDDEPKASSKNVNAGKAKPPKDNVDRTSETRTRRRRRPRRRPKKETSEGKTCAAKSPKPRQNQTAISVLPATKDTPTSSKEIRPLRIRGVPPANQRGGKNHVRFDAPQTASANSKDAFTTISVSPDLQKYGPSSVQKALPRPTEPVQKDNAVSPQPVKDKWKRPYEIISSIHDTERVDHHKPTLDSELAAFPLKPADSSLPTIQTDDVVAYKTLTLCMKTFQPVLSDWQCGQVVDALDGQDSATIIPYELVSPSTSGAKLAWRPSRPLAGEDASLSVSLSEISELRYLEGPTKQAIDATNTNTQS